MEYPTLQSSGLTQSKPILAQKSSRRKTLELTSYKGMDKIEGFRRNRGTEYQEEVEVSVSHLGSLERGKDRERIEMKVGM